MPFRRAGKLQGVCSRYCHTNPKGTPMRFILIVLGWVIATSALSAITALPGSEAESSMPPSVTTG